MKIDTQTLTEQHATWIASNPVVGCPKNCAYCFLKLEGLNCTTPKVLAPPQEAIEDLLKSAFYQPDIPIATGTRTDYFATTENVKYLKEYAQQYSKRGLTNPLVMITKCHVPDEVINLLTQLGKEGTTFIFFLSYSGLGPEIEVGIDHKALRNNFKRLHKAKLKVIHYWRPFVPQNSTKEVMSEVIEHTTKYSGASVIAGLRLTPEMREQFWFWKEARDSDIDLKQVEGIWPEHVKAYLEEYYASKYPNHPICYASSCAIANVLSIPDFNGFYESKVCKHNSCPKTQRGICGKFRDTALTENEIKTAFKRLGIPSSVGHVWDVQKKTLTLDRPLEHSKIVNLTQTFKVHVKAEEVDGGYGWGSSVTGRKPYYIKTDRDE